MAPLAGQPDKPGHVRTCPGDAVGRTDTDTTPLGGVLSCPAPEAAADGHVEQPVSSARWRWAQERLTERIDVRFSQSESLRLWRYANLTNSSSGSVIRTAVRELLDRRMSESSRTPEEESR
jgi:hypothetical protein